MFKKSELNKKDKFERDLLKLLKKHKIISTIKKHGIQEIEIFCRVDTPVQVKIKSLIITDINP